jgi:hypothetical protein
MGAVPHMQLGLLLLLLSFGGLMCATVGFPFCRKSPSTGRILAMIAITIGVITELWCVIVFDRDSIPLLVIIFFPTMLLGAVLLIATMYFGRQRRRGFPMDSKQGN